MTKFYRVTGKQLRLFLLDWRHRYDSAIDDVIKFSKSVGGHGANFGHLVYWGSSSISIMFDSKKPPECHPLSGGNI